MLMVVNRRSNVGHERDGTMTEIATMIEDGLLEATVMKNECDHSRNRCSSKNLVENALFYDEWSWWKYIMRRGEIGMY